MRIRPSALIMALLVGCALVVTPVNAAAAAVPAYQIAQQIALPAAGAGVAVDSDRGLVYVAGRGSAAVWVYDEATLTLQRTIAVPNEPYNLAVGPTGLVYVTQYTGNNLPGTVSVISPVTNTVVATSPVGNSPVGVTVSQDGDRLYVANLSSNFLSVFDLTVPESPVAEPSIPLPRGSETVSQSADGSTLFVPNNGGSVFVVAAGAGTLLSTWTGFNSAHQVSLSTDGRQAFVSQQLGGPMPVFSVSTNTRTGTLPLTTTYYQSIDPGVGAGFITQPFTSGGTLAIIDQADGSVLQSLSGVPTAYYPAADSKTHSVFVTSIASSTLTKIVPTLAVIEDPVSQTIPDGSTATFSAAASGAAPIATQWQSSSDGGGTWVDVIGATEGSYTTPPATLIDTGLLFRARLTDASGSSVVTTAATLTVVPIPVTVITDPVSQTVQVGDPASFSAAATGSMPITVQWQSTTDGGTTWADIAGATDDVLTVPRAGTADDGTRFRAVFSGPGVMNTATSAEATLTVTAAVVPTPTPTPTLTDPPPSTPSPAHGLAVTGGGYAPAYWGAGILLTIAGAGVVLVSRRRLFRAPRSRRGGRSKGGR